MRKLTAVILAVLMLSASLLASLSACDLGSLVPGGSPRPGDKTNNPDTQRPPSTNGTVSDGNGFDPGLPLTAGPPAIPIVLRPVAAGTDVQNNDKGTIDYSNTADGYIMIKWTGGSVERGLRVQIIGPTGTIYTYTLNTNAEYEVYPLSDGNGTYTARIVNLLDDGRGTVELSIDINVRLNDEFGPFLYPNQYVNFSEASNVVAKAAELVNLHSGFFEKVAAIYSFVTGNITYDTNLANEIIAGKHPNYLPVLDSVLERRKGICFDFAAVMTAMLRSQGIPTKLVVGNVSEDLRHAWINVYSEEDGWLDAVIYFDRGTWKLMDPTFASAGGSDAIRDFIGDGSNYQELYLY